MNLIQHPHVSRNFLCAEAEDEETILSEHAAELQEANYVKCKNLQ